MPCLSIPFNPKVGPLIQIAVFPPGSAPPVQAGGPNPLGLALYFALIDTGASHTCISTKVIKETGLQPTGKLMVGGVHGNQATNSYQFQVGLMFPHGQSPTGAVLANIAAFPVSGMEFISGGTFDVLLGRDILCQGSFVMSFDGHAMLSV